MVTVHVQFSDPGASEIIAYFASKQNDNDYPNLGEVELDDPRWIRFWDSLPENLRESLPAPLRGL